MTISIAIKNPPAKHLASQIKLMGNMVVLNQAIGAYMVSSTVKTFERQGRPKKWAPLAASTLIRKRKAGKTKILQWSGALMGSITFEASSREVAIGSPLIYAGVHQYGIGRRSARSSRRVMGAIPARPYLQVLPADVVIIGKIVRDYFRQGMRLRF